MPDEAWIDADQLQSIAAERLAEEPFLRALQETLDIRVANIDELMTDSRLRQKATDVILSEVCRVDLYPDLTRAFMAYALMPDAVRRSWHEVVRLYTSCDGSPGVGELTKDALADSLGRAARPQHTEDLRRLVEDPGLGPSRIMLLPAVRRVFKDEAEAILRELSADPDLREEASHQLTLLRRQEARRSSRRAGAGHRTDGSTAATL